MTFTKRVPRQFKSLWLSAWPFCALLAFASLAAVRPLPGDYMRAMVAAPILLLIPGSLTLAAVFSQRKRPRGVVFAGYAALLSVVWSAFASLALYVTGILITANSTYWCLLVISAVLALAAEARLLLEKQGGGRRVARKPKALDLDLSYGEADDAEMPAAVKGAGLYSVGAVVAGVSLLAGGLYTYDHLPRPAPVGYTWIAWTDPPVNGDISIGSSGMKLDFKIVHRQSDTTTFRLSAKWLGNPSRPLAKPVTLSIGPNQTFRGALFIPPLPNGCTYRIMVALSTARHIDPLIQKAQTWSVDADLHDPSKSSKMCK